MQIVNLNVDVFSAFGDFYLFLSIDSENTDTDQTPEMTEQAQINISPFLFAMMSP